MRFPCHRSLLELLPCSSKEWKMLPGAHPAAPGQLQEQQLFWFPRVYRGPRYSSYSFSRLKAVLWVLSCSLNLPLSFSMNLDHVFLRPDNDHYLYNPRNPAETRASFAWYCFLCSILLLACLDMIWFPYPAGFPSRRKMSLPVPRSRLRPRRCILHRNYFSRRGPFALIWRAALIFDFFYLPLKLLTK